LKIELQTRLESILQLARKQDWEAESFSVEKAQVCAKLSSIVYEDVQEYELKNASRIHLFASDTFRSYVKKGKTNSLLTLLKNVNLEAKFFISRGRDAVIFGTIFKNVVILAVRGTVRRNLWDWKTNIDTQKYYVKGGILKFYPFYFSSTDLDDQFFHRGFFESVVPQFASIADAIKQNTKAESIDKLKIVWTGHSLGGAMAAIGYAMHKSSQILLADKMPGKAVSAYTFGMPRYCGLGIICNFESPYHIYIKQDIVPTLPLRKMGFTDGCNEYELQESGHLSLSVRTDSFGVAGHIPKLLSSIKAHSIEGYATLLS